MQSTPKVRPTGVTIIAILNILRGIIALLFGLGFVALGAIIPLIPQSGLQQLEQNLTASGVDVSQIPLSFVGGAVLAVGGILIAIGIFSFVLAYGLLKGKSWAWTLTVVLSIINIVVDIIAIASTGSFFNIITLIISGIILYYLYRPHVKAYFGRVSRSPPAA